MRTILLLRVNHRAPQPHPILNGGDTRPWQQRLAAGRGCRQWPYGSAEDTQHKHHSAGESLAMLFQLPALYQRYRGLADIACCACRQSASTHFPLLQPPWQLRGDMVAA